MADDEDFEGPEGDDALRALDDLEAVAQEHGAVIAFRVDEESELMQPVFLDVRVSRAADPGRDAALILRIEGAARYVMRLSQLRQAIDEAERSSEEQGRGWVTRC